MAPTLKPTMPMKVFGKPNASDSQDETTPLQLTNAERSQPSSFAVPDASAFSSEILS